MITFNSFKFYQRGLWRLSQKQKLARFVFREPLSQKTVLQNNNSTKHSLICAGTVLFGKEYLSWSCNGHQVKSELILCLSAQHAPTTVFVTDILFNRVSFLAYLDIESPQNDKCHFCSTTEVLVAIKSSIVAGFLFLRWKRFVSSLLIMCILGDFGSFVDEYFCWCRCMNDASMYNDQRRTTWLALNAEKQTLESILLMYRICLGARKSV